MAREDSFLSKRQTVVKKVVEKTKISNSLAESSMKMDFQGVYRILFDFSLTGEEVSNFMK
jgi:hypothetical protein